jgi:hypothetical protein
MAWCQTMGWPLIQIALLASWHPFESAKKNQKWAKAIITKRWAKVPIPIMRQQFTACLTWLQYGFLNHNSTTEMLSQSFWEDVGNQLLLLSHPFSLELTIWRINTYMNWGHRLEICFAQLVMNCSMSHWKSLSWPHIIATYMFFILIFMIQNK